jgi:general secretion pathway protein L
LFDEDPAGIIAANYEYDHEPQTRISWVRSRIGAFLVWWRDELLAFVPERIRALFRDQSNLLYAARKADRIALYRPTGRDFEHLGDIGMEPDTAQPPREQLTENVKRGAMVALVLPRDKLLQRKLTLPAVAEDDLHEAARYEMERRTPFTAADAYYDVAIRNRDAEKAQIEAELYVAPRALLDDTVARLASVGLRPFRAGVADDAGRPDQSINFLPAAKTRGRLAPGALLAMLLGLTTLALATASLVMPIIQKKAQIETLSRDMSKLRKDALDAARLREDISQLTASRGALERERARNIPVTAVLDELTKRLPDNTWLNQLRINGDEISIFGFTETAPRLIAIIEGSPAFSNATFPTPVRPDPRTGKERFHITFRVVGAPGK